MGDYEAKPASQVDAQLALEKSPESIEALNSVSSRSPLNSQAHVASIKSRRQRLKSDVVQRPIAKWFVENQIGLSLNLLVLLFLTHTLIPKARVHTVKFFQLAYHNERTGLYGNGFDDGYFIFTCIVLYTGLRAGLMDYVLMPLARAMGVKKPKDIVRFAEQAWLLVYYFVAWPLGMYLYCTSDYYLNFSHLYLGWPWNRELEGVMKAYFLAQGAFWIQQIIVINIEERRKDHWQMLSHHIITISLIFPAYCYHHTRIGHFVLIIMDIVDLFFPLAKCLKYSGYDTLCDIMFGLFMVTWFGARHVVYGMLCWSIWADAADLTGDMCFTGSNLALSGPHDYSYDWAHVFEPFYKPRTGRVCMGQRVVYGFLTPLVILQLITIFWFFMIVRVAIKVIRGDGAEDTRSDDEEEEEEEIDEEEEIHSRKEPLLSQGRLLEQEVGADSLDFRGWERRSTIRKQASSSGVSLPGHTDRKELLGRIGCDKQME